MKQASRAIIIKDGNILVMHRNKHGSEYYTLVGGRQNEGEIPEQTLAREVKEETDLDVIKAKLVFTESHAAPYNHQYIFLCEVAPFDTAQIQSNSEEAFMNKLEANTHKLVWVSLASFERLAFRTPQLHQAIIHGLKHGFPDNAVDLSQQAFMANSPKKRSIFGRKRQR